MTIYTIFEHFSREPIFSTWSFDAMLAYRDAQHANGITTFMRYNSITPSMKTVALFQNQAINYGRRMMAYSQR